MELNENSTRILEDPRLVAGYIRDAALSNRPFILTINNQEIVTTLLFLEESSARSKGAKRRIYFQIITEGSQKSPNLSDIIEDDYSELNVSCRVAWDRMLIKFNTSLLTWDNDQIIVEAPTTATIFTNRKSHRFSAEELQNNTTLVSIINEMKEVRFGNFELKDLSLKGFGGLLSTEFEINNSQLQLEGALPQDEGSITLNGNIIRIKKKDFIDRTYIYDIGVSYQSAHDSKSPEASILDEDNNKRSSTRLKVQLPIEISTPIAPRSKLTMEVIDLSYSGLRASFLNNADHILFQKDMIVKSTSPNLELKVLRISNSEVTFRVLSSSISEHLKLFYLKTTLGERDLTTKPLIAEDILQVYSVSGSLSSGLVKNLRVHKKKIINSLKANTHTKPWFLRWMQQNEEGRIRSIIMTVPYGNHFWYCGGAAGHMDPNLKASSNFFSRFFKANIEFFETIGSKEFVSFNWFKNNERWDEWEKNLSNQCISEDFFRFDGDIVYINDNLRHMNKVKIERNWEKLEQGQFLKINSVSNSISHSGLKRFSELMGLTSSNLGADGVLALFTSLGQKLSKRLLSWKGW